MAEIGPSPRRAKLAGCIKMVRGNVARSASLGAQNGE